ncbi:uncharacterized protein B0H18DRAFT_354479 [Fomitopsis serialis]|uniref:uncharacterized protein n=1 Tax=Fomitopsis serialis TaxID=139415 RepID=UPI0020081BC2|nr:uncharacterized protein B0H18DRAFT_354479 [Neoantrodia serialis]KAH9911578.1 hypothetical protein B0H18DRAFT_354479 [Neoantrodia serialis]
MPPPPCNLAFSSSSRTRLTGHRYRPIHLPFATVDPRIYMARTTDCIYVYAQPSQHPWPPMLSQEEQRVVVRFRAASSEPRQSAHCSRSGIRLSCASRTPSVGERGASGIVRSRPHVCSFSWTRQG